MAIPAAQNSAVGSVEEGSQGGRRQQHDARARRRVRDRHRRRRLRRARGATRPRRRSPTVRPRRCRRRPRAGGAAAAGAAGPAAPERPRSPGVPSLEQEITMRQVMVRYKVKPDRVEENEGSCAPSTRSSPPEPDGSATRRSSSTTASASCTSAEGGRRQLAQRAGCLPALRGEIRDRWMSRRPPAPSTHRGIPPVTAHPVVHLELTPATCRAPRVLPGAARAGARSDRVAAAPTSRSRLGGGLGGGRRCARRRRGCPTSRSTASTRSPSARGGSAPRAAGAARGPAAGAAWSRPRRRRLASGRRSDTDET